MDKKMKDKMDQMLKLECNGMGFPLLALCQLLHSNNQGSLHPDMDKREILLSVLYLNNRLDKWHPHQNRYDMMVWDLIEEVIKETEESHLISTFTVEDLKEKNTTWLDFRGTGVPYDKERKRSV